MHHDPRVPMAPPPPAAPVSRVRVPASGEPDGAHLRSGPQGAAGPAGAPYYEVAYGEGRVQVLVPSADQDYPSDVRAGTREMPQLAAQSPAELLDPVRQDAGAFRDADSVRLAERILADADSQATGIKQQALDHANAIRDAAEREAEEVRQQAAYQADALRGAEQEAEEIRRQAAEQADAIREAATREADELRAGAIRLSAELGQVAAYVTRTLTIPAIPAAEPPAALPRPGGSEDTGPTTPTPQPQAWEQGDQPTVRTRPQGRPRPQARPGRQAGDNSGVMPAVEPQAWEQDAQPAARPRPQARPRRQPARTAA